MHTSTSARLLLVVILFALGIALLLMRHSRLALPAPHQKYAPDSTGISAGVIGTSLSASQNDSTTRNVTEWERIPEPLLEVAKHRYPDSIIIGCKKSGTGTLLTMLNAHPDIQATLREINYYKDNRLYSRGLSWYIRQMALARKKDIVMEKSNYFEYPESIGRIYKDSKTVKLILIVRNPVTRAISDYVNFNLSGNKHYSNLPKFEDIVIKNGTVQDKIQNRLRVVYLSLYDVHYMKWLNLFKKDQILVVNGEQLISQPVSVLQQVEKYLGLKEFFNDEMFFKGSKGFFCWSSDGTNNRNESTSTCMDSKRKGHPHPTVDESVVKQLNEYFTSHMEKFCNLAQVNFPWCSLT